MRLLFLSSLAACSLAAFASAQTYKLDVDASDAPKRMFHAKEVLPVKPGQLTLWYPEWIPGEHMPSGPLPYFVNQHFYAGGKELEWRRDLIDLYAYHLEIPEDASELTVTSDYLCPTSGNFGAGVNMNANLAILNWYEVMLYPQGSDPNKLEFQASLKTPEGWTAGGSLDIAGQKGSTTYYKPTTLTLLCDHPISMGKHFKRFLLEPATDTMPEHALDVVADDDWALKAPQDHIDQLRNLVHEERAVMDNHSHYTKYHWLLTLSDNMGGFGVEHWECSDDRVQEKFLTDEDNWVGGGALLSHEFFHSWNGKTRRPASLTPTDYNHPMADDLLWVYEGLTNYYGEVLAARAGIWNEDQYCDTLAADAMQVSGPGRTWRPLQDTADYASVLYTTGDAWFPFRRGTDYYAEGSLIWLTADVLIRQKTNNAKSLDDFCKIFHAPGGDNKPLLKTYTFEDVCAAMNQVLPYDWKGFFETRLRSKNAEPPLDGIRAAGFEYTSSDAENHHMDGDVSYAIQMGFGVGRDGKVAFVLPGSAAFAAGLSFPQTVLAVNGHKFSPDVLKSSAAESAAVNKPLVLLVQDGNDVLTLSISHAAPITYPHLVRKGGEDWIAKIIAPKAR